MCGSRARRPHPAQRSRRALPLLRSPGPLGGCRDRACRRSRRRLLRPRPRRLGARLGHDHRDPPAGTVAPRRDPSTRDARLGRLVQHAAGAGTDRLRTATRLRGRLLPPSAARCDASHGGRRHVTASPANPGRFRSTRGSRRRPRGRQSSARRRSRASGRSSRWWSSRRTASSPSPAICSSSSRSGSPRWANSRCRPRWRPTTVRSRCWATTRCGRNSECSSRLPVGVSGAAGTHAGAGAGMSGGSSEFTGQDAALA